jgi:biopolymer transport protein ExbD
MPVRAAPRKRRPITLTPLIDIIFLLLLFFMLSSTFTRFAELPLMNASGRAVDDGPPPLFLQLTEAGLRLNGTALTLEALPGALAEVEPTAGGGQVMLFVTLDDAVTSQELVDLLAILRGWTWLAVSVLG